MTLRDSPLARGSFVALVAALLFGATAPVIKHFGAGTGAFATATLLYAGAAMGARIGRRTEGAGLPRADLGRVAIVAVIGAALAPACLAWGLQRTDAIAGSLLLNMEVVFTILLARLIHREPIGRRVALAVVLMLGASALLAFRSEGEGATSGVTSTLGLAGVTAATACWALDNTLTRPLADLDPRSVVFAKGLGGAALSLILALALRDAWPSAVGAVALLACGATGFGLSLQLYLRAQRTLGVARTASLFAAAPFVGAVIAYAMGDRANGPLTVAGGALFAVAIYLHATEAHAHHHTHDELEHDHDHRHDDGHHLHEHDPPVKGSHRHAHRHGVMEHSHAHGPDLHHQHHD